MQSPCKLCLCDSASKVCSVYQCRVGLVCDYFISTKLKAMKNCEMRDKLMGCNTTLFFVAYFAAKINKSTITRRKESAVNEAVTHRYGNVYTARIVTSI